MPFKKPTFNVNIQPQFGSRPRALRQRNTAAGVRSLAAGCHLPDAVACSGDPGRSCLIVPPAGLGRWEVQESSWEGSLASQPHCPESFCLARTVSALHREFLSLVRQQTWLPDGHKEPPKSLFKAAPCHSELLSIPDPP